MFARIFSFTTHDVQEYALGVPTAKIDLGRGTFKTSYILSKICSRDVLFVRDVHTAESLKPEYLSSHHRPIPCDVFSAKSLNGLRGRRVSANIIWFDEFTMRQAVEIVRDIAPMLEDLKGVVVFGGS